MRPLRLALLRKLSWGSRASVLLLLYTTTAITSSAQTFTTLHSFDGADGHGPAAGLVQAANGLLYGTTSGGGASNDGTVFKILPDGTLTTLYSFCSQSACADGKGTGAVLVQAPDGNLYGTTAAGATNDAGTVFEITPKGALTTLYSFCSQSNCTDGYSPQAGLVRSANGDLYGITTEGGASNSGTVFKVTPGGTLTTLHSFCSQSGCADGELPQAALVQVTNGDFYGVARFGGASGVGTVFQVTPSGTLTTIHSFDSADGASPFAGLIQAANGNLYGTTPEGGANGTACPGGCGTVFEITPSGTLTTLYSFCSQSDCTDGSAPFGGLVQATDGNFFGTTSAGGAKNQGTVFEITPNGTLTTLHSLDSIDGTLLYAGLVQDTNGNFYGTTASGGANDDGTVFALSVGLDPFVETQPTRGGVGAAVKILGTKLNGASNVAFDGTGTVFTVVSDSEIRTTVPTGASTGLVTVTTPAGTLTSNQKFQVTP